MKKFIKTFFVQLFTGANVATILLLWNRARGLYTVIYSLSYSSDAPVQTDKDLKLNRQIPVAVAEVYIRVYSEHFVNFSRVAHEIRIKYVSVRPQLRIRRGI